MKLRYAAALLLALSLFSSPAFAISDQFKVLVGTAPSTRTNFSGIQTTNSSPVCLNASADDFIAWLDADAVSGTLPTLDVKLQESFDGASWKDTGMVFTQVTTVDGTQKLSSFGINYLRCFRAVVVLAGTAPVYNVLVRLQYRPRE